MIMPGVNYAIYGCSSSRATPGVSLYRSFTLKEKHCCNYYSRHGDRSQSEKVNQKLNFSYL